MINTALKTLRQYHNLKQGQLAGELSISISYLSEIESGKKEPSLDLLQRYARHFGVPLSSLVAFSETLDGTQSVGKVRSFISRKMLKILEWIADQNDSKNKEISS